jgi:hypothetical protein
MTTKNLTANGMIALAPTYELKSAHRDDAGNVYVFVKGLNTWRLVNESAHLFRPDATPPAADAYTPPATHHPKRCYCGQFAPGHAPGLLSRAGLAASCNGDTDTPHDASTCPACLAGATDGPAPDPASVQPGSTVTLTRGAALVRDVVIEVKRRAQDQFVFYTSENPDPLIPGTYYLVNAGAWTLTDHEPARR